MRKLLLILLCIALLLGNVFAASDEITNMDAQITVDTNGICHVTVSADVRFVGQPTTFRFPLGTDAKDISASGASFDRKTIDGIKYVVFENKSGFSGTQTFQCSYTLPCTMRELSTGQRFTAKLPEQGWDYPINRYNLTIQFPTEVTDFPRWQSAYYGDVIDNYLNIQVKDNSVTAKSSIVFRDHETLTMDLDFEPDSFVLKHLAERTVKFDRLAFIALYIVCIGYWLIVLFRVRLRQKNGPAFHFQFSAGEIPCQLFGEKADIGSLIAHWGNLGYVLLRRTKSGRYRLEKQMEMGNERSTAERRVFQSIFRSTSTIEVPGPRFMAAVNSESPVLRAHWRNRMFRKNDGKPKVFLILCLCAGFFFTVMLFDTLLPSSVGRWIWIILLTFLTLPLHYLLQQVVPHWYRPTRWIYVGIAVGTCLILYLFARPTGYVGYLFFTLLLQLGAGYATRFGGLRTIPGRETLSEILNFRHFVVRSNQSSAARDIGRDSQYYYRGLPYAEILGVDKRFRKYYGSATTEPCPWLIDERDASPSPESFYLLYKDFLKRIRSENRNAIVRSLARNIESTLPRIRPISLSRSSSRENSRSRSSGRSSATRSTSHRSTPRRPSDRRTSSTRGSSSSRSTQTARSGRRH